MTLEQNGDLKERALDEEAPLVVFYEQNIKRARDFTREEAIRVLNDQGVDWRKAYIALRKNQETDLIMTKWVEWINLLLERSKKL